MTYNEEMIMIWILELKQKRMREKKKKGHLNLNCSLAFYPILRGYINALKKTS